MSEGRIPTSVRMLRILEVVGASDRPLSALEIKAALGLPKQSAHRLCARLAADGYLVYSGSGKLQPGFRFRQMSRGVLLARHYNISRRQILLAAAERLEETINFAVPQEDGMTYIDRVETDWPLRIQFPIGASVPFHCTAGGKTYLASLPEKQRRQVVERLDLRRQTPNTICSPDQLLEEPQRRRRARLRSRPGRVPGRDGRRRRSGSRQSKTLCRRACPAWPHTAAVAGGRGFRASYIA